MDALEIKELYDAQPFEPFEMVLPNGATAAVEHPEFTAFSPGYKAVHIYLRSGGVRHIEVRQVVELRQVPPPRRRKAKS